MGKEIRAYRLGERPPRIDGKLDDEVWTLAEPLEGLVQQDPDNMQPATERTVVRVAYDDRAVYVAAWMYMKDMSKMTTALGRRDTNPRADAIYMTFDPRHDHLTAYTFNVNASGVQNDLTWFDDQRSSFDYEAVWEARTQINNDHWTAEFRIPFSQMRFSIVPGQETVWGFNVRRDIVGRAESDRWIGTPRGVQGFVSRFGHLTFPAPPAPPRRFELQPFTLGKIDHTTNEGRDADAGGGIDMRLGLGTAATLSAAVNPDFGQVEQDPAVLNLSVYETFFPEKRPFFVEDSRTMVPPYPAMVTFHSRRIGQRPGRFAIKDGDRLIERPDATTILGATKVTGKTKSGWTYGGLTALTDREYAQVEYDEVDAAGVSHVKTAERLIEPLTSFNVVRVQRDIRGSNVGGIATGVLRDGDFDAYTGGLDYTLRWDQNRYNWNGHWIGTRSAIDGVMQNGFGGVTNFNYSRKHYGIFSHYDYFDREFKNTDLGFLGSRKDKQGANVGFNIGQPDPQKHFRSMFLFIGGFWQWNGDGLNLDNNWNIGYNTELLNFWSTGFNIGHTYESYDDLDTRGGPPIVKPSQNFYNFFLNSDNRKKWQLNFFGFHNTSSAGNNGWMFGPNLRFQPRPALQFNIGANYQTATDAAQWITNTDVTGDGVSDHVYGRLKRNVININGRATYAFTRDMTLEVYMQPFVAVGDYSDIRRFVEPKTYNFEPVEYSSNPDFNSKSFRSNVVYRWEYRPGSTLFVVWNASNFDGSRPGEFSPWRDLRDGITAPGTQVFMVKLNYWLGL